MEVTHAQPWQGRHIICKGLEPGRPWGGEGMVAVVWLAHRTREVCIGREEEAGGVHRAEIM